MYFGDTVEVATIPFRVKTVLKDSDGRDIRIFTTRKLSDKNGYYVKWDNKWIFENNPTLEVRIYGHPIVALPKLIQELILSFLDYASLCNFIRSGVGPSQITQSQDLFRERLTDQMHIIQLLNISNYRSFYLSKDCQYLLRMLSIQPDWTITDDSIVSAIYLKYTHTWQWMIYQGHCHRLNDTFIINLLKTGSIQQVQMLIDAELLSSKYVQLVVSVKNVEIFNLLRINGIMLSDRDSQDIIMKKRQDEFDFLLANGYIMSSIHANTACYSGNFDVLEKLHNKGINPDNLNPLLLFRSGHIKMVKHLVDNKLFVLPESCDITDILTSGHILLAQYLHTRVNCHIDTTRLIPARNMIESYPHVYAFIRKNYPKVYANPYL